MNKFISIASLFIIYAILIVSSNGKTTTMLQENLKKRATSTSEQSMYIQKMISKKRFGASSAGAIATDDKQCDEEKGRLQDEIDALRAEVKDLKEKAEKEPVKIVPTPTKPCPMPMCAAVMPRPGCKHVMTKEKNERGCLKYPCGKEECEPEIIGKPEKCPESVDRCKVGEKKIKDPNVYWNNEVQLRPFVQMDRPRRGLLNKENALPPSAMLDRCGYVYICVPDTKKCPAKEPRHCPVARCIPPSKGCKYVQDDERKENCCRKHICGKIECDGSSKLVIGGEDRKENNKGNNGGDYIEYDATKLEDYLNGLCRGGKGVERIKTLLDTTGKDKKGRVLLSANCYKDGKCDCMKARRNTDPFIENTDKMSMCMETDRYMQTPDKHSLGNPYHTGESHLKKPIPHHMKNQYIIKIDKPAGLVAWCFVKKINYSRSCRAPDFCPLLRRRRLLDRGNCGS